jgi:hypothetical protein
MTNISAVSEWSSCDRRLSQVVARFHSKDVELITSLFLFGSLEVKGSVLDLWCCLDGALKGVEAGFGLRPPSPKQTHVQWLESDSTKRSQTCHPPWFLSCHA